MTTTSPAPAGVSTHLFRIVGFLVCVEIASGILQGWPCFDGRHDYCSARL